MIDSHCHLADSKFAQDLPEVIARAKRARVDRMIVIGDTIRESEECLLLTEKYPELFCAVGVHPHGAKDWKEGDDSLLQMFVHSSPKVRAIGEIGLDFHYDFSPREIQHQVFRTQLLLAKELQMPAVVHCREAVAEIRAVIEEVKPPRVVIHCCSERFEDVEPLVAAGHFLSFTGIATYKTADVIRDCIRRCPINKLMIETDAPYLAPVPHRGKRNEPEFVVEVARLVAEVKGMTFEEVDAVTTRNTVEFFGLPK